MSLTARYTWIGPQDFIVDDPLQLCGGGVIRSPIVFRLAKHTLALLLLLINLFEKKLHLERYIIQSY